MNESTREGDDIDPVTIEVLNNRLHQISREAGATLTRTAASPVTVEAKDLGFNITTPTGENVVFSVWMPRHGTTLSHMVKSTIEQFDLDNINEGDMFLTNDPYEGALHIMDLAVLAPVHYNGELIAWTGCATHHLDVGAMTAGWPSRSTDWYQEGVKYPPIKLMEDGEVQEDVFELFLRNVRLPEYQGLDLKAQIAANTVSRERIQETADEYGSEALRSCYEEMIEYGERTAREQFEALPDGEYRHVDYLDYDDVYRLECTLTVDGEELIFDFSGTDEQAPSFVNCAYPCSEANLHNALQVMLFPEATVNAGTFDPVDVEIPEGTVFNCSPPNPCAGASIYAGWRVMSLAVATLSKALEESDDADRATAEWGGGMPSVQLTGQKHDGSTYTLMMTDSTMLGGGARYDKDGIHAANVLGSTNTSIPNVEYHEQHYPIRYLRRGLRQGSGGVGEHRGGFGGELAFTPVDTDEMIANPFQHRRDSLPFGLFGGYPGQSGDIEFHDFGDVGFDEISIESRSPERTLKQQNEEISLQSGQVLHIKCAAGGAIGDPLERDIDAIADDLAEGVIDTEQAINRYGVVVDEHESTHGEEDVEVADAGDQQIHSQQTETRRKSLREERARAVEREGGPIEDSCNVCDGNVYARRIEPSEVGLAVDHTAFELEELACIDCGHLADVRVTVEGKPW